MRKAAFLDRDGVINREAREGEYVTRWEEMEILPGVTEAIRLLNQASLAVIVVSNQRCVAKGMITTADLEGLHRRMSQSLASAGAVIDAIYYCPHESDPPCPCRKPQPGMLFDAARDHDIDLSASWMVGDSRVDMEAGRAAGCKTAFIGRKAKSGELETDIVAGSLLDSVQQILQREEVLAGKASHAKHRARI
jgi:D-glycero-D-manno-heptose 1,7-bisphosphate phosphatase